MAATQEEKAARFRALHQGPGAFVIANPWDAGSARVLAGLGFSALATSSGAAAGTLGRRDGQITRDQALAHARLIATGPATVDLARRIFNDRLDAVVCGLLMVLVSVIVIESATVWINVISGRRAAATQEAPFVATQLAEEFL